MFGLKSKINGCTEKTVDGCTITHIFQQICSDGVGYTCCNNQISYILRWENNNLLRWITPK